MRLSCRGSAEPRNPASRVTRMIRGLCAGGQVIGDHQHPRL